MLGATLQETVQDKSGKTGSPSHLGVSLNDPTIDIDRCVPQAVNRVPSEAVPPDRIRETSIGIFLILEGVVHDLVKACSVGGEVRPSSERVVRNIDRSGVSQTPLVAVNKL